MTPHVNDMTTWADISCGRGHTSHHTKQVHVNLTEGHGYHDYPPVPSHLAVAFDMNIWDWSYYLPDAPEYCPAHDAVSETIEELGIWEPVESILALHVFSTVPQGGWLIDLGCQIGWFSNLVLAQNLNHIATSIDADAECIRLVQSTAAMNGWFVNTEQLRFGTDDAAKSITSAIPDLVPKRQVRLVKMDLEGAEANAVDVLWPAIREGLVDHILMEVSPCFNDSYPPLLDTLCDAGFELYALPEKRRPPHPLIDPSTDLTCIVKAEIPSFVASFHQTDVWLKHSDASW